MPRAPLAFALALLLAIAHGPPPALGAAEDAPAPAAAAPPEDPPPAGAAEQDFEQTLKGYFDAGDDERLVAAAEERLKEQPGNLRVRLLAARALARMASGEDFPPLAEDYYRRAYEHLQTVRLRDPSLLEARIGICDIFYHMKRLDALLSEIKALLEERPGDEILREELRFYAEEFIATSRPERAASVYDLLSRAWPDSAELAANRGTAYLLSGRLEEGIQSLQRAARLDPADADTARNLAQAHLYAGDAGAALEWFRKARTLRPESGRFVLDLAVVEAIADPERALPLFREALEILGGQEIQRILVEQLRIGVTSPLIGTPELVRLASELDDTGYPVYALAAAEKALRADPGLYHAVLLRARISDRMNFHGRTLQEYRRARGLIDSLPEEQRDDALRRCISGEAQALVGNGDAEGALALLRSTGTEESYLYETVDALEQTGQTKEARRLLERAIEKAPDAETANLARERLKRLAGTP